MADAPDAINRKTLIALLNADLAREFRAVSTCVVYSQTLKGAQYLEVARELEAHAGQALQHALTIARQIDYLGGTPTTTHVEVPMSSKADGMLQFDLDSEGEAIINYRERVAQCEALGEYAIAEEIHEILRVEQEHRIELATAMGTDFPQLAIAPGPTSSYHRMMSKASSDSATASPCRARARST